MSDFLSVRPVWKESGLFWESQSYYISQEKIELDPKKEILGVSPLMV